MVGFWRAGDSSHNVIHRFDVSVKRRNASTAAKLDNLRYLLDWRGTVVSPGPLGPRGVRYHRVAYDWNLRTSLDRG